MSQNYICSMDNPNSCLSGTICGNPSQYGINLSNDNISNTAIIFYGIVTFDNIISSMLTIFQSITLYGWS